MSSEPIRLRQAVITAMRCAVRSSDVEQLVAAGDLSLRAIWPSLPNAGVLHALQARPGDDASRRLRAAVLAIQAVHLGTLPGLQAPTEAPAVAEAAREQADTSGDRSVLTLALEAWIIGRQGHPDVEGRLVAAVELCEVATTARARGRALPAPGPAPSHHR